MDTAAATIPGRFAGQTAIVTGAASGIGAHVARRLAREGAHVALWDLDATAIAPVAAAIAAEGGRASARALDIADEPAVAAAVAALPVPPDVAVHCAGIVGPNSRRITEVAVEDFDRVQRVNLRGSFVVAKQAIAAMRPRGYGRVLLFASIAGKEGNAGMCPYSASKAGVIALAKSAGKEFAETGITVNAIAPGVVRTALVEAMDPAQVAYMTDRIPMKRTGTLDEVTALACWIVSREAGFTTGFAFDCSGGRATY